MFPSDPAQARRVGDVPLSKKGARSVAADKTLKVFEQNVYASVNTDSGNITITLPSAAECAGLAYFFHATIANSKTVTIADPAGTMDDVVLDVTLDRVIIISDGTVFLVLLHPSVVVLTDSTTGSASDTLVAMTNIDLLVDSTGGSVNDTVSTTEPITDTDMTPINGSGMTTVQEGVYDAMVAEVNTALSVVDDNFKEVTDQIITQKALNTALINAIASLAAKVNLNLNAQFNNT